MLFLGALLLFGAIGITASIKKFIYSKPKAPKLEAPSAITKTPAPKVIVVPAAASSAPVVQEGDFPQVDRIGGLFTTGPNKLPIVETVTYDSHVPWLKGR